MKNSTCIVSLDMVTRTKPFTDQTLPIQPNGLPLNGFM